MAEFTGERVIPWQVDADLLNEHVARYMFAAELAGEAHRVVAMDLFAELTALSREDYRLPNSSGELDPVAAYEVIERIEVYGYLRLPCRVEVNARAGGPVLEKRLG